MVKIALNWFHVAPIVVTQCMVCVYREANRSLIIDQTRCELFFSLMIDRTRRVAMGTAGNI